MPGYGGPGIHLEHLHRYLLAASIVDGAVLDLGCGVGYGSRQLARAARRVVGLDGSPPAIGFARVEFTAPNLDYLVGDARVLPFPAASFDWVVCFELIEHLRESEAVLAEIARVLSADGRLLLSTPNRPVYSEARGYSNPFHVREFDIAELRALLSRSFDSVVLFGQRLMAGSAIWDLGRPWPARRIETFQPEPDLGADLLQGSESTYLLALCQRRQEPRQRLVGDSVMAGRLEAFLEEQASRRDQAEAEGRAEYQAVVDHLVAQLGEFDARIRQLGGDIERHHAERQGEVARLSGELAEERSRRLSLEVQQRSPDAKFGDPMAAVETQEALERRHREQVSALEGELEAERSRRMNLEVEILRLIAEDTARREKSATLDSALAAAEAGRQAMAAVLAERDRQTDELRQTLERTRADLDWSYWQWQGRESELNAIQRSKMWRLWMAYQSVRRTVLSPIDALRRGSGSAGLQGRQLVDLPRRVVARALGWLYLVTWTAGAWLSAVWRGGRLPTSEPDRRLSGVTPLLLPRRPRILIVCPYSLYPADHGGAVRIYNLIRRLSRHCDLHLLIFIQGDDDPNQRQALEPWVQKLNFHHWRPRWQKDIWGLKPRGVQLFEAPEVRSLVNEILSREQIDILQLEYTELGQYGLPRFARVKVVLSEIDISFRSRARRRQAGMHRRYELDRVFGHSLTDWMRQFHYELQVARRADQVHVMSHADGAYLARFLPGGWQTIRVVPNAVDLGDYRPPADALRRGRQLLFVGNFEHLPNLDALDYLLREVWPQVRQRMPNAELLVVGARAGESVRRYDGHQGVTVVGSVPETKPYYQRCRALVAPIRAGSGTRLKILEALACAVPVVTTTIGAEGIDGTAGEHFLIADSPAEMIEGVCRLLEDDDLCVRLGQAGRELIERRYSWEHSAAAAMEGYARLLDGAAPGDGNAAEPLAILAETSPADDEVDISIVVPTLNGGAVWERCLAAVRRQQTQRSVEIVCVDSGSSPADLATMERYGARIIRIDRSEFNHGLTRDLGAAESRGRVLVFLNQDAVPCDSAWLENLVAPLFAPNGCVAVQGAIVEIPDNGQRFYWDSCGDRFYFTRESKRWIERYFGIGFSTVNAAIRRDAWERHPFGYAPIMEDKKWQREIVEAGYGITVAPHAAVFHTHNYDMNSLWRRCVSEGFGWRTLGETYSLFDMLADILRPHMGADLLRGLVRGQIRSWAELLFPLLRPLLLFRGNRWSRAVRL
ncbi:MAG TPA: glycosyltransferase [Thermoanaerobaculia bacterium]|nr:glycosyltransferase [Thermoanaerobaculia bacterium]